MRVNFADGCGSKVNYLWEEVESVMTSSMNTFQEVLNL